MPWCIPHNRWIRTYSLTSTQRGREINVVNFAPDAWLREAANSNQTQLSAEDVELTKRIANERIHMAMIHIECTIKRIKHFRILHGAMSLKYSYIASDIFKVCTYIICNSQPPLFDLEEWLPKKANHLYLKEWKQRWNAWA